MPPQTPNDTGHLQLTRNCCKQANTRKRSSVAVTIIFRNKLTCLTLQQVLPELWLAKNAHLPPSRRPTMLKGCIPTTDDRPPSSTYRYSFLLPPLFVFSCLRPSAGFSCYECLRRQQAWRISEDKEHANLQAAGLRLHDHSFVLVRPPYS